MPPHLRAAYESWVNQRRRCLNKSHRQYKYYGAKGITVKYGAREFVGWWEKELRSFKGKVPTVGRINHSGHYEFSNIVLQDKSDNSKEVNASGRIVRRLKPVRMYCYACGHTIKKFNSQKEASEETGIDCSIISGIANKRHRRTHEGYAFEFIGGKRGKTNNKLVLHHEKRGDESP